VIIESGDKVHVVARRLFEGDLRRHFVGIVDRVVDDMARVRGYAFVYDESMQDFVRRDEERIRLIPLADSGLIINMLPAEANLTDIRYALDDRGYRVVTDGHTFSLEITEFGAKR